MAIFFSLKIIVGLLIRCGNFKNNNFALSLFKAETFKKFFEYMNNIFRDSNIDIFFEGLKN